MFSRQFPLADRGAQWAVSPGQLGQTPAGELGRCGEISGCPAACRGNEASFMGVRQVDVQVESQLCRRGVVQICVL